MAATRSRRRQATKEAKPALRGPELLRAAVNQIITHPETWNQADYGSECGTTRCIAGWCVVLGGGSLDDDNIERSARIFLGILEFEAAWLFDSDRTLDEIYRYANSRINWASAGEMYALL